MLIEIRLQQLLKEKRMSQRELERRTKIFQPTISKMCSNNLQHMPLDALAKICEALECEISDVLRLKKNEEEEAK
ncbi:helix-turn-helix domain-containing protein [Planococcus rifietoensis]|uniref:helix-turn-helix domain-containing protein n=1 Tax=Planococcus rifietoensis TaxID=200991 RepID=UPI00385034ED